MKKNCALIRMWLLSYGTLCFALPTLADDVTYTYDALNRLTRATYSNGQMIEYNYDASGNRTSQIVQTGISGLPDLVVTEMTSPASGIPGENISFVATVMNQGTSMAAAHQLRFFFSRNAMITTSDFDPNWFCGIPEMAPGTAIWCRATLTIPSDLAVGSYYLGAYADSHGVVLERNESNNGQAAAEPISILSILDTQ